MKYDKKLARLDMLDEMKREMMEDDDVGLKEELPKKMKKVTVMSDSEEGLEKGLSKAEQILKGRLGEVEMDDEEDKSVDEDESSEEVEPADEQESEEESEDYSDLSPEELVEKIKMLEQQLKGK